MPTSDYTPTEGCVCLGCEHARHVATVTTYLPSDRAQKYARSLHYKGIPPVEIAAEGFDAGIAAAASDALATVTPRTPERVHVTKVLTTADQLDALPSGSVVIDSDGDAYQKQHESDRWLMVGITIPQRSSSIFSDTADIGPATLLVPATATPEPVRLTDPDDPRIRVGALVEITYPDKDGESVTYRHRITKTGAAWGLDEFRRTVVGITPIYLIAEAPADPDEPILAALRVNGFVADQLAALRAAGYDVVKQAL